MAIVPVVECKIPTVTLSSSTFRPVVMILAVGKSAALVVDFSRPGGVRTVAPVASVERSVVAGAAFSDLAAAGSPESAALDFLHPLLVSAAHSKEPHKTIENATRETRLRLERTSCMRVSIYLRNSLCAVATSESGLLRSTKC
jgi:hypothetical protein